MKKCIKYLQRIANNKHVSSSRVNNEAIMRTYTTGNISMEVAGSSATDVVLSYAAKKQNKHHYTIHNDAESCLTLSAEQNKKPTD